MKTITELLFSTKKFGNKFSEINEFLQDLKSKYIDYIDFEILEQDDLSTIEIYGIREIREDDLKKCYIVVCESWEYNDENYYQPDDEPYTLKEPKLYSKDEAEKLCKELNEKHGWENEEWNDELQEYSAIKINPYKMIKLEV